MSLLLTICARGGSKGVPRKNLKPIAGKPLIAYTIEQAQTWGKADRIVVSTDDAEIANVARSYGIDVPFMRPAVLADDRAPKVPVIRHAWETCCAADGVGYDAVVDLDVSAPLRRLEDIDGCHAAFLAGRPLTLFSVVRSRKNPYFNMVEVNDEGFARLSKTIPGEVFARQAAPAVYDINGCIYFYDRTFLSDPDAINVVSSKSAIYEMPEISATDIDTPEDFDYVEHLLNTGRFKF